MAEITHWLKRIGRPAKWYKVLCKTVIPIHPGRFELWFTDPNNRVLRCRLDRRELSELYAQLQKFFA
jgi:hypothetical protein